MDPPPVFLERARELAEDLPNLSFVEGNGRALPLEDASFDVVVFHTVLCHVPEPEVALAQAMRVLRPTGQLAVFDGDYATVTRALAAADPLQALPRKAGATSARRTECSQPLICTMVRPCTGSSCQS